MPIKTVPGTGLSYYLICVDGDGVERTDDPDGRGGRMIARVVEVLARQPYTDVIVMSHGWMGDVPAAIRQYDRWTTAMAACEADLARARHLRPGFKPLLIGFHWPSLPFGDEELGEASGIAFFTPGVGATAAPDMDTLLEAYAERIAGTPAARQALATIFAAATADTAPPELSAEVIAAYCLLDHEAGLGAGGPAGGPGGDREVFDPKVAYQLALEESQVSFGSFSFGPVLGILRNLSFFKMKDRARHVGETSVHELLGTLQRIATDGGRDVRFHLMGHSFGCIVMSAALAGPPKGATARPVHSVFLAQGAVSFWSYCNDIPYAKGQPGYFHRLIEGRGVAGALVTTQSEHDTAVCKAYPAACFVRGDVAFAPGEFPKYGALGQFGVRGPGIDAVDLDLLEIDQPYVFEAGKVYNLECSRVIARMESLGSGAHNDIAHPQVAHALWSALLL